METRQLEDSDLIQPIKKKQQKKKAFQTRVAVYANPVHTRSNPVFLVQVKSFLLRMCGRCQRDALSPLQQVANMAGAKQNWSAADTTFLPSLKLDCTEQQKPTLRTGGQRAKRRRRT